MNRKFLSSAWLLQFALFGVASIQAKEFTIELYEQTTADVSIIEPLPGNPTLAEDSEATGDPTGVPGESDFEEPNVELPGDAAFRRATCPSRNKVTVQWCDQPGDWGTVCRLKAGCKYDESTKKECREDAVAVCGSWKTPFYLY